jgi:hypothetical protein
MHRRTKIGILSIGLFLIFVSMAIFLVHSLRMNHEKHLNEIEKKLSKLSIEERENLDNFFKFLILAGPFGYTLYGDKSISIETYNTTSPVKNITGIDYMSPENILNKYRLREGWETWKKYAYLFPMKNFSIISNRSPQMGDDFVEITLINHKAFIHTVNQYLSDFQSILGINLKPEEILAEYCKGKGEYFDKIRGHDGLFGTLLGFGRDNSWAYLQIETIENESLSYFGDNDIELTKQILLPRFRAIPNSEETEILSEKYYRLRNELNSRFKNNDYCKISISKLIE